MASDEPPVSAALSFWFASRRLCWSAVTREGTVFGTALERFGGLEKHALATFQVVYGAKARHGFDAAHVRAGRRFGNDTEQADLCGIAGMRTATELARERLLFRSAGNHAHHVAVLLAKKRHGTRCLSIFDAHDTRHDRLCGEDLAIHKLLDTAKLFGGETHRNA